MESFRPHKQQAQKKSTARKPEVEAAEQILDPRAKNSWKQRNGRPGIE